MFDNVDIPLLCNSGFADKEFFYLFHSCKTFVKNWPNEIEFQACKQIKISDCFRDFGCILRKNESVTNFQRFSNKIVNFFIKSLIK